MSTEEAEFILNEAVINHPSINGYIYISAEEINQAIDKVLEEVLKEKTRIKELEETIAVERVKLENIIKEMKIENYKSPIFNSLSLNKYIERLKKVIKPLFWLEN